MHPVGWTPEGVAARVFSDARRHTTRIIRNAILGLGVPIVLLELFAEWRTTQGADPWNLAEAVAVIVTGVLLLVLPSRAPAAADKVLVAGLSATALFGLFHSGPGITTGVVYMGWVLTAVFYLRSVTLPSVAGTLMMVVMAWGSLSRTLGFRWPDPWPAWTWYVGTVTTGAMTAAIAYAFGALLDRFEVAVEEQAIASHEADEARAQRALALEHVAQAQRLESLGRLAGGVAHDFNNALSVLMLCLEGLRGDPPPPERAAMLDDMERAARGAHASTRQLLSFSRSAHPGGSSCVPAEVVDGLARSLRRLLPVDIRVEVEVPAARDRIPLATGELEQLLLNLALNARDAMPGGGVLTLRVLPAADGAVRVEVTDTGSGMTEEVRRRALEPFFTTKEAGRGTGLGLAMVHRSVRAAGGAVTIDSAPGQGTTVRLDFPAVAGPSAARPAAAAVRPATRRRVLYVEDEENMRRLVAGALERAGHDVHQAETLREGCARLESLTQPDLLLTDAVLPDGRADALIAQFRARFPGVPVIVCTGHPPDDALLPETAAGTYTVVQKPFAMTALLRLVEESRA